MPNYYCVYPVCDGDKDPDQLALCLNHDYSAKFNKKRITSYWGEKGSVCVFSMQ